MIISNHTLTPRRPLTQFVMAALEAAIQRLHATGVWRRVWMAGHVAGFNPAIQPGHDERKACSHLKVRVKMRSGLVALALAVTLAACTGTRGGGGLTSADNVTNAPVAGGVNVAPGSEEDFMVNVGRRTFFQKGSAALDDTARATLDKQASWLTQYPQWKVKVQGSADDPGGIDAQRALSQQRADAVKNYLASLGVAPERMLAKGYGREKIGEACPEIECQAQNRRVITNLQENPEF